MSLVHHPDWEIALARFAAAEQGRPFVWGETNCLALALRALDTACGSALMDQHRAAMATARRARLWVKRNGLNGVVDRLVHVGARTILPGFQQAGDIALTAIPGDISAAVCLGLRWLSSTDERGVFIASPGELIAPHIIMGVR